MPLLEYFRVVLLLPGLLLDQPCHLRLGRCLSNVNARHKGLYEPQKFVFFNPNRTKNGRRLEGSLKNTLPIVDSVYKIKYAKLTKDVNIHFRVDRDASILSKVSSTNTSKCSYIDCIRYHHCHSRRVNALLFVNSLCFQTHAWVTQSADRHLCLAFVRFTRSTAVTPTGPFHRALTTTPPGAFVSVMGSTVITPVACFHCALIPP